MSDSDLIEKYRVYFSGLSTEELLLKYKNEEGKWSEECVELCGEELIKRGKIDEKCIISKVAVKKEKADSSEKITPSNELVPQMGTLNEVSTSDDNEVPKKDSVVKSKDVNNIDEPKKKYNKIVRYNKCIFCGGKIIEGDRFCSSCGRNLIDTKRCKKCGAINEKKDNFCSGCGARF